MSVLSSFPAPRLFPKLLSALLIGALLSCCLPVTAPALAAGPVPLDELPIVRRQEWGAGLSPIWPESDWLPSGQTPMFLVVHHTVTPNTADPLTTVRSIWHYHAVSQGWGDIRYHYLIDQQGRIYEGRSAGDKSSNIYVEGAQSVKNNNDKVAIALLGQFQPSIDYPPPDNPTPQAIKSLVALLAAISYEAGIDPLGSTFHESDQAELPNVGGHRDHSQTSCPGDNLYNMLPQIREQAAAQVKELQKTRGQPRKQMKRRTPAPLPEVPTPGSFTLVYSGDLGGQLLPDEQGRGGAANLVGLIDHIRISTSQPLLLLGAGALHPGSASRQDEAVLEALEVAGYDAWVPDGGDLAALGKLSGGGDFVTLAANVVGEADGQPAPGVQPYVVKTLGNLNVAVIGLADGRSPATLPAGLRFLPAAETLQKYLPEMRKQANLVVVLSHLGHEADREIARGALDSGLIVGVGEAADPALEQVNGSMLLAVEDGSRHLGRVSVTRNTEGQIALQAVYEPLLEVGNSQDAPPDSRIARLLDPQAGAQQNAAKTFSDEHGNEGAPALSQMPLATPSIPTATPVALSKAPPTVRRTATANGSLALLFYGGAAMAGIILLGLAVLIVFWPGRSKSPPKK